MTRTALLDQASPSRWRLRPGSDHDPKRSVRAARRSETATLRLQAAATLTRADDNIRLPGLTLMRGWLAAVDGDIETALSTLRPMLFMARESRNLLGLVAWLDERVLPDRTRGR